MQPPSPPTSLESHYRAHMIPVTFAPSAASLHFAASSSSSSSSSSSQHESSNLAPVPYFAQAHMYGVAQDAQPVRRSLLVDHASSSIEEANASRHNALLQSSHRAVDVQRSLSPQNGGWYQPHDIQPQHVTQKTNGLMLDAYGNSTTMPMASYQPQQPQQQQWKDLAMPRLESLFVSVPRSFVLPSMPEYIEATSFSCVATPMFELKSIWNHVRTNLEDEDACFVAEETPYALTCAKSCSLTCTEFNVRCYSGHYSSAESTGAAASSTAASGSWMTVEFQRRSGCCVGVMSTFRRIMRHVSTLVHVESKISMEEIRPAASEELQQEEGFDMTDVDLAALAMPSLARSTLSMSGATPMMMGDASVYDSLMDMISSSSTETQIEGMNALALCLDGSHPQSIELLREVALKIEGAGCLRVREAAAKVVAQASNMPSAAALVVQHCLPLVLRSIMHAGDSKCGDDDASLDAAFDVATKKHLLRSCVQLSSSVPHVLDAEGSAVASSKFRRELLRMSATGDDEVKGLAVKAMNAITV